LTLSGASEHIRVAMRLDTLTARIDRATLEAALEQTGWNVSLVSRAMGVDRRTLYRSVARHALERPNQYPAPVLLSMRELKPRILRALAARLLEAAQRLEAAEPTQCAASDREEHVPLSG
jgi:transposase-like protein